MHDLKVGHIVDLGIGRLRAKRRLYSTLFPVVLGFVVVSTVYGIQNTRYKDFVAPGITLAVLGISSLAQKASTLKDEVNSSEETAMNIALELLDDAYERVHRSVASGKRDRVEWLTAARNIVLAEQISRQIENNAKAAIYTEKEHLVRLRFNIILDPKDGENAFSGIPSKFFADSAKDYEFHMITKGKKAPVAIPALVEIYRFSKWPSNRKDILQKSKRFTADEIDDMITFGPRELGWLMEEVSNLTKPNSYTNIQPKPLDEKDLM